MVYFIGAGPGDPGLLTIKGRDVLSRADVVIYAGSLVNPALLSFAKADAAVYNSAKMTLSEVIAVMETAEARGKMTARLHTGDPSLYGALFEQLSALFLRGIPYEIIPGVSAVFAAAAALGLEYTLPGVSQSLILTRAPGRTGVPEGEALSLLASHGTSMALYLSAGMAEEVRDALLSGAYTEETPCAVVYKASWPEETVVRGRLGELPALMEARGINRTALIIVGEVLAAEAPDAAADTDGGAVDENGGAADTDGGAVDENGGTAEAPAPPHVMRSRLYAPDFSTGYRDAAAGQKGAVLSFTGAGAALAERVEKALKKEANIRCYASGADFSNTKDFVGSLFPEVNFLLFIGAAGIAVRTIAPHIRSKATDPAVLVMDEAGQHVISLLSGHLGQANRWCERIAAAVGASPVITTATDVQNAFAVDTYAIEHGFSIEDPKMIKEISARILRRDPVGVYAEEAYEAAGEEIRSALGKSAVWTADAGIAIVTKTSSFARFEKACRLYPKNLCVGIGCKKGKSVEALYAFLSEAFAAADLPLCRIRSLSSVEKKREEAGLIALSRELSVPFHTFSAETLSAVAFPGAEGVSSAAPAASKTPAAEETVPMSPAAEPPATEDARPAARFSSSPFVQRTVGTDNVCERSAVCAAGENAHLLLRKIAKDGMTLAVAEAAFPK